MLSYLQSVGGPSANFGTRQFPLGAGEHVISLFAEPDTSTEGKEFGVNGRPGDIYTVPEGRKLTIYQMDFSASYGGTGAPPSGTVILMDSEPDGTTRTDVAAFYPDVIARFPYMSGELPASAAVFKEVNDIDRPFVAGRQPRCRITTIGFTSPSLEIYGIEGPA